MPSLSWFGTGVSEAFQFIEDRLEHFPYRLVNVKPAAGVFDIGGFRESEFRVGQQDDHYGCEYHATADNQDRLNRTDKRTIGLFSVGAHSVILSGGSRSNISPDNLRRGAALPQKARLRPAPMQSTGTERMPAGTATQKAGLQ